jgi:hypothetical protein
MKKFKTITALGMGMILLVLSATVELAHQHPLGFAASSIQNPEAPHDNPSNPTLRLDCPACAYSLASTGTLRCDSNFVPVFIEAVISVTFHSVHSSNIVFYLSNRAPPTVHG